MSQKKIITILIIIVVIYAGLKGIAAYNKALSATMIPDYGYSAELFLAEGGFESAKKYANSICAEFYCNETDTVYADLAEKWDMENRYLSSAVFSSDDNQNHLYFIYKIPPVEGVEFNVVNVTGKDVYMSIILELFDVKRTGEGDYSCQDFYIYSDDKEAREKVDECIAVNAESIESDSVVRRLLDYGVLYCNDMDLYEQIYELEKTRLTDYLLLVQKEAASKYSFSTNPDENEIHNQQAVIKDVEQYFAEGEEINTVSENKLDYETSVSDIFNGKMYDDYREYNKQLNEVLEKEKSEVEEEAIEESNAK